MRSCGGTRQDGAAEQTPELHPFLAFFTDYDFPQIGRDSPEPTAALLDALNGYFLERARLSKVRRRGQS